MTDHQADILVFSREIEAASISSRSAERRIEATADERAALAEVLELQAVDRLVATLRTRRLASGLIEVSGEMEGEVVQSCVITLEPVPAQIRESFRLTFGDAEPEPTLAEIDIHFDDSDPPEPIIDGKIDLGALVAEQLSLALDLYPRKEGAEVPQEFAPNPAEIVDLPAPPATRKPFAGLDKLKK